MFCLNVWPNTNNRSFTISDAGGEPLVILRMNDFPAIVEMRLYRAEVESLIDFLHRALRALDERKEQ